MDAAPPHVDSRTQGRSRGFAVVAALLFALALVVRFANFDLVEFGSDEFDAIMSAARAIEHGGTSHGVSASVGILLPPFYLYLLAVPVWFTRDPLWVTAFIALLNALGLGVLFALARRLWGARPAALVVLLVAAAPWATVFSRKIWNPDVLFPLAAAFYLAFFATLEQYRRWRLCIAFVFFGLLNQIHPSAWFLAVPLVLFLALFRPKFPRADVLLGCGLFVVLYTPWFYYLWSSGFDDLSKLWSVRSKPRSPGTPPAMLLLEHLARSIDLAGGTGFDLLLGPEAQAKLLARPGRSALAALLAVIGAFEALATAAAIAWSAWRVRDRLRGAVVALPDQAVVLFALIYVFLIGGYTLLGVPAIPHYHVILYPIVAVFTVWFLLRLCALVGDRAARWSLPVVGAIVLVDAGWTLSLHEVVRTEPRALGGRIAPYGPARDAWASEFARAQDDLEHGAQRRAERQAELAARFQAAPTVLLRYDSAGDEPALEPYGKIALEPSPQGLLVRGGGPLDMLRLPELGPLGGGPLIVRLELTLPREHWMLIFFQTRSRPEYIGRQSVLADARAGRDVVYIPIDEHDLAGRLLLRIDVYSYRLHALEVRRVAD